MAVSSRSPRLWALIRAGKLRVTALFLLTAWVGYVLSARSLWSADVLPAMAGLALTLMGAGALNQYLERGRDRLMRRTRTRPLVKGDVPGGWVLAAGAMACVVGVLVLRAWVGPPAAALAAAGFVYYLLVYTVLAKPRSPWSAVIGGPAGVFPFLVGWVAGGGRLDLLAVYGSALLFCWSPAHFWALAVAYEEDYARAGIPTPVSGRGREYARLLVLLYAAATVSISLLPAVGGYFGARYLAVAVVAGAGFGLAVGRMWRAPSSANALLVHKASGAYLAVILVAWAVAGVW